MSELRSDGFSASPSRFDEMRRDQGFSEKHVLNDNGGLSNFHRFEEKEEGSGRAKLIGGALVVALLLGGAGIYMYSGGSIAPQPAAKAPAQMASNMPAPAPQPQTVAPTAAPSDNSALANSPYAAAPAAPSVPANDTASTQPAQTDMSQAKPVKSAKAVHKQAEKDQAKANADEAPQTAELNRAADTATAKGSVAVPMSAAPSSTDTSAPVGNNVAGNSEPLTASSSEAASLPAPPAPPASSMASNGEPQSATPSPAAKVAPEQTQPVTPAADAPAQQPDQPQ